MEMFFRVSLLWTCLNYGIPINVCLPSSMKITFHEKSAENYFTNINSIFYSYIYTFETFTDDTTINCHITCNDNIITVEIFEVWYMHKCVYA